MDAIETVRSFNRFYTQLVGALEPRFLGSEMSLPEVRLLFEIGAMPTPPLAADLVSALELDPAYVSRVLARFEARGWITRARGEGDARRRPISLTEAGAAIRTALNDRQRDAVATMLARLSPGARTLAVGALADAQGLLGGSAAVPTLRTFRPGDMGLIASRQAVIYHDGWGWGRPMEVLLGEVTTGFLRDFRPDREQCWVGEVAGRMAGSIFCCDGGGNIAKLRLLYVEDFARGLGLGEALVDACIGFARTAGYAAIELWTHTILTSARRIYAAKGFTLTRTEMHEEFGEPIQGEYWRLEL